MTTAEYNRGVDEYSDNVYRFILKNIRNEEKARDIIQESFAKLWLKVDDVSFDKMKSYLFSTAYRTMIDMIRREKKQGHFDEVDQRALSHSDQYSDLGEILEEAIKTLPEIQRTVLMLRDYEGYSYREIGEITDLNESQVKVYIFRARKTLKAYLGDMQAII